MHPNLHPASRGSHIVKRFKHPPVNATIYRMLVEKLLYLTKTRPDIAHAVGVVSRYMQNPQEAHLQAAKHILRYVRRYPDLGLFFKQGEENHLRGFTDVDYGQDVDDKISVGAFIFYLGNSPISWNSNKQSSTSQSSCESEYRALAQCSCEVIWIRRLLGELKILSNQPTHLYCDNQSSIKLSYNLVFHEKSKHFEIDFHFTRQKVEDNIITVDFIPSQEQPADILTKSLGRTKFEACRNDFISEATSMLRLSLSEGENKLLVYPQWTDSTLRPTLSPHTTHTHSHCSLKIPLYKGFQLPHKHIQPNCQTNSNFSHSFYCCLSPIDDRLTLKKDP